MKCKFWNVCEEVRLLMNEKVLNRYNVIVGVNDKLVRILEIF